MTVRDDFLLGLKQVGLIESYEYQGGSAIVYVKRPISYFRIEVLQVKCKCGCCDVPDHGPCNNYELGGNGRCAHCDHHLTCHES